MQNFMTRKPPPGGRHHPDSGRAGFTLTEMLIVIAIIALLTAIILPVLGIVRGRAHETTCQSNLKQLGLAFQQYASDNNRRYPYAANYQAWGNGGSWVAGTNMSATAGIQPPYDPTGSTADVEKGAIYPYVKEPKVFYCPGNVDGDIKRQSYSMNCAISLIHDVRLREPSAIVLLVDEDKPNDGWFFAWNTTGSPVNSTDALSLAHNGGGNLLFCDGHVKKYTNQAFILNDSPEGLANKARQTGIPRFHDRAFGGTSGTAQTGFDPTGTGLNMALNACAFAEPTATPPAP